MLHQHPLRHGLRGAPAILGAILVACAGQPVDSNSNVVVDNVLVDGDSGGLPTKPLDAGLPTKDDAGLPTKDDAGLPTKDDAGLPTKPLDAGLGTMDAGQPGADDSGIGAPDAGASPDAGTGLPDAGGIGECLACAEQRCGVLAMACVQSSACVEEAQCDLRCLGVSAGCAGDLAGRGPGGLRGLDPRCFSSCVNDQHPSPYAPSAVACALALCPKECHPM